MRCNFSSACHRLPASQLHRTNNTGSTARQLIPRAGCNCRRGNPNIRFRIRSERGGANKVRDTRLRINYFDAATLPSIVEGQDCDVGDLR